MKQKQIWIVLALLLGMGAVLYYFYFYRPYPKYDWFQSLNASGKQPYDLDIFNKHLQNLPGITTEVNKGKPLDKVPLKSDYQAYIFIDRENRILPQKMPIISQTTSTTEGKPCSSPRNLARTFPGICFEMALTISYF